jgi:hypothetical protein
MQGQGTEHRERADESNDGTLPEHDGNGPRAEHAKAREPSNVRAQVVSSFECFALKCAGVWGFLTSLSVV